MRSTLPAEWTADIQAPSLQLDSLAAQQAIGLIRVGEQLLGLPIDQLGEVIACPPGLHPVAVHAAGLCGMVDLRGLPVPVLDLRELLGMPPAADGERVIVVMRWNRRLLGMRCDGVSGMVAVNRSQLLPLSVNQPALPLVARYSVMLPQGHATVLDAARLANLPGVPTVAAPALKPPPAQGPRSEALIHMRCESVHLTLDALDLAATTPFKAVQPSPLAGGACRGVIAHHGLEIPLVDTLELLGLGRMDLGAGATALVLRCGGDTRVALAVHAVYDIVHVAAQAVQPVGALGVPRPALLRGLVQLPGNGPPALMLDGAALRGDAALAALARMCQPVAGSAPARERAAGAAGMDGAGAGRREAFLLYRLGAEWATPLADIHEIVAYPEHVVAPAGGSAGGASLGVFSHRGHAVPLVCLGTALGKRPAPAGGQSRVLVVDSGAGQVGFLVERLHTIDAAHWQEARPGSRRPALVEVGEDSQRRTVGRLDLRALAQGLLQRAAAPVAEAA